jgi:hypothetical protein
MASTLRARCARGAAHEFALDMGRPGRQPGQFRLPLSGAGPFLGRDQSTRTVLAPENPRASTAGGTCKTRGEHYQQATTPSCVTCQSAIDGACRRDSAAQRAA